MTGHDDFDRTLAGWFEADALSPAPASDLDRVLDATRRRRPLPGWLAAPGSHWVGRSSDAGAGAGLRSLSPFGLSWSTVLLLLLAIAAVLGGAILVGGRLFQPSPFPTGSLGRLAYGIDGDIFVADGDGRNPVRIADGVPVPGGGGPAACGTFWGEGPMWSPDGRYLAYRSAWDTSCRGTTGDGKVFISDPAGDVVASFPGSGWLISWSPNSTRVATWIDLGKTIGIYGLDGVRKALLIVPSGCALPGDFDPVWSPDGGSLVIWPCEVPIDGRTPARVPGIDPRSHEQWAYSPDNTRVAYVDAESLLVAASDGSQERVLVSGGVTMGGLALAWSPTGDRIAFAAGPPQSPPNELRVVDLASGTITSQATARGTDALQVRGFSPGGDQILYSRMDANSVAASLWSVQANGSGTQLVATGTGWGDWQPLPVSSTVARPIKPSTLLVAPVAKAGLLDPGTYDYLFVDEQEFSVRFTVPAGWTWNDQFLSKGGVGVPGGAAIFFFGGPVQVYADPCHWAGAQSKPPTGLAVTDLMAALTAQPMRIATTPIDRPANGLGGAPGWAGIAVGLTVPGDLNFGSCDGGQFRSWGSANNARAHQGPGQRDLVWAVDLAGNQVNFAGQRAIIDAASFPGTPPEVMSEIEAILASIEVGHWG